MSDLRIKLNIGLDYIDTITYDGRDIRMAEALVALVKLNYPPAPSDAEVAES
jgi:hypothetical protein